MTGHREGKLVRAHSGSPAKPGPGPIVSRELREQLERATLRRAASGTPAKRGAVPVVRRELREPLERATPRLGATFAQGAGNRPAAEEPHDQRTWFERDRDRTVHSTAFGRLAGKTQVVV